MSQSQVPIEVKSILKVKTLKSHDHVKLDFTTKSHSIGAVRWTLPEEQLQTHSSVPVSPIKTACSSIRSENPRHQGLKDLQSLHECITFINSWKEQVVQVCQATNSRPKDTYGMPESLEESRKLILQWSKELKDMDMVFKQTPWRQERANLLSLPDGEDSEVVKERIMNWARELQALSESCGVPGDKLPEMLQELKLRKKLLSFLPFLEFITWSLLKEGSKGIVPQLWLSAKQHTWKAGNPKYIPSSVWNWICSAEADITLDPMTNHPWLQLSNDGKQVQEALSEAVLPSSSQRFDGWPCVLGWEGFSCGRHYWEVDLANNGYWRVGVTTGTSQRRGRFAMLPEGGFWVLWRSTRQFYACTGPETPLPVALVPCKLGIYLDYEEGQISFFNAANKSHIFTFTDTFKEKLYPLLAPLDGRTLLSISSPSSQSSAERGTDL